MKRLTHRASFLAALLLLVASNARAGSITLSWTPPTEREDGTLIAPGEIAGFNIYYGTAAGDYIYDIDVPVGVLADPLAPSYTVPDLDTCTIYYLVMTTYDSDGRESLYSEEVILTALYSPVVTPQQGAEPGTLQLDWSGLPSGDLGAVESYDVYYDANPGEPYEGSAATQGPSPINVASNMLQLQLTGLPFGAMYYVVVDAVCPDDSTQRSAEVSSMTGAAMPADGGLTQPDTGAAPRLDAEVPTPWPDSGATRQSTSSGGCRVAAAPSPLPLILLLALLMLRRRVTRARVTSDTPSPNSAC